MYVLGIDPSSKKIALVGKDDLLRTSTIQAYDLREGTKKNSKYSPQVSANAMDAMLAFIESVTSGEKYAYIEAPLVGRGGVNATIVQSYVSGPIQAVLYKAGFTVEMVNVGKWKQQICGNGNADKAAVSQAVSALWPKAHRVADGDGDLVDAAAICLYGQVKRKQEKLIQSGSFDIR